MHGFWRHFLVETVKLGPEAVVLFGLLPEGEHQLPRCYTPPGYLVNDAKPIVGGEGLCGLVIYVLIP